jgi:hypothetical protein
MRTSKSNHGEALEVGGSASKVELTCDDISRWIDKNIKEKSISIVLNIISSNKISFVKNIISEGDIQSCDHWVCGLYIGERVLEPIEHESSLAG